MKAFWKKNFGKRIGAFVLALLLAVAAIPSPVGMVKAETDDHPGYITITVVDDEGNAVSGATVEYVIEEKDPGDNGFMTVSGKETTDSYGTVEVLETAQYYDDLTITASVSKSGYKTETIISEDIESDTQDFQVKLTEDALPDIEGVSLEVLDEEYTGEEQDLISVSTSTEDVKIEYSTDGTDWSLEVPKGNDAGEYDVYVKISKDGYNTYISDKKTAQIRKKDILGIDITGNILNYIEDTSQKLITLTGEFEPNDIVSWYVDGVVTDDSNIPEKLAVGSYSVKIVVNRGNNYNEFTKTVTADILNAELDITGLIVEGLDSVYDGNAQNAVKVQNIGDYTLMYQLDDGDQIVDSSAWSTSIPTVTDAGSYIVWVKAVKTNYDDKNVEITPAENAVAPYNVYIAKAEQTLEFDNYSDDESYVEITAEEMKNGKVFDFSATDINQLANGTISYSVELESEEDRIASIEQNGELTVIGAGKITVVAELSGDSNYESCTIRHILYISGKTEASGNWISVPNKVVEYTLGDFGGVPLNTAVRAEQKDKGAITYSIENASSMGLNIDETGAVSISDYEKIVNAIEMNNGLLNATINIDKAEYKKGWWGNSKYPADSVSYTLKVSMADAPDSPYKIYSADDIDNELTEANGSNGWYNTALIVKPIDGYEIIRADELTGSNPMFASTVKFGEISGKDDSDQGDSKDRCIYLRSTTTGDITKKVVIAVDKLDSVKPYNLGIVFPDAEDKDGTKYYDGEITVTFVAYDDASGVDQFEWKYTKEAGVSSSILDESNGMVTARLDTSDSSNKKYIGTLTLPENQVDQLRGNLQITAIDKAGNRSTSYTDTGVFVVDTIAPTQKVEYQLKDNIGSTQTVNSKHYFSNDVIFTFTINEANFFADDVNVFVSKDGGTAKKQTLSWKTTEVEDEYQAAITLYDDADYVVSMTYTDRSGKIMTSYTSETIVIDKISPVIEFGYMDGTDTRTEIVKVIEHNFRPEDVCVEAVAKNIIGEAVNTKDLQQYLRNCEWVSNGDEHIAIVESQFVDGIYELTFNYKDLAFNEAEEIKTDEFIVDRTAPETAQMSISYSNPIFEKIMSAVTFGYYNPSATVTFTAHDEVSGIQYFTWSYLREAGASDSNVAEYTEEKIAAVQDSVDKTKYTATVKLPRSVAEQIRGTVSFTATDNYKNTSNKLTDSNHVLIVDTIAPELKVEYSEPDNSFNGKDYYNSNLTATFIITEANFDKEDVKINIRKNDGSTQSIEANWRDTSSDTHMGTIIIDGTSNHSNDGEYVFLVSYRDKSNNEMATYESDIKVVDTTKPVIDVKYSNENPANILTDAENNQREYYATTQTATVTITERNFNAEDVKLDIVAKDVAGNELNSSEYYSISSWVKQQDNNILTITYPGDANYTFNITCTDLAKLEAEPYETDFFTVDTTKPDNLNVSYSTSLLDTVLSAITFGFYNSKATVTVTATDNITGINSIKYSYKKADGVSGVNAELIDEIVEASDIASSEGGAVGTVVFEIPRSLLAGDNQFNGTIEFTATDRANNESDYLRDMKRIVVDNIAPTADVQYNAPIQISNGISYYDGDISATVTINEANFYAEDVAINIIQDGVSTPISANWSDSSTDVHVGTFTITGDGDYFVDITYSDKSANTMQEYKSEQLTIDTEITEALITINGQEADGRAFKDDVVLNINFNDKNFESCDVKLFRTSFEDKNIDVTDKFITGNISLNENGGSGESNAFDKVAENDGIYTLTTVLKDKAGHTVEKNITFTINRFGSVYEYNDYLIYMISNGGAYVQSVDEDFVITEYNADKLLSDSLNIEISRDGKPLDSSDYVVTPDINDTALTGTSGWYQYSYTIAKENFESDGVYKIAVSSRDAAGNSPENNNYKDKNIIFRVDSTAPEITSISGLENQVVNATEQTVKYAVYDTIGLDSVTVYVDDKEIDKVTDFTEDMNNYSGAFVLKENTAAQKVRLVVSDRAGNITDTDAEGFISSYVFNKEVTVSTNMFVRLFANKAMFYGIIGGGATVMGAGTGITIFFRKRKIKLSK